LFDFFMMKRKIARLSRFSNGKRGGFEPTEKDRREASITMS
jgi:hypothetical protein